MRNTEISPEVAGNGESVCIVRSINFEAYSDKARNRDARQELAGRKRRATVKEVSQEARNTRRLISTVLRRQIKRGKLQYCRSISSHFFHSATGIRYFLVPRNLRVDLPSDHEVEVTLISFVGKHQRGPEKELGKRQIMLFFDTIRNPQEPLRFSAKKSLLSCVLQ